MGFREPLGVPLALLCPSPRVQRGWWFQDKCSVPSPPPPLGALATSSCPSLNSPTPHQGPPRHGVFWPQDQAGGKEHQLETAGVRVQWRSHRGGVGRTGVSRREPSRHSDTGCQAPKPRSRPQLKQEGRQLNLPRRPCFSNFKLRHNLHSVQFNFTVHNSAGSTNAIKIQTRSVDRPPERSPESLCSQPPPPMPGNHCFLSIEFGSFQNATYLGSCIL